MFGFGIQTTGWIPTKLGMDLPLDPVGNLKILFWVDPARGGIILEKLKNPNFPHMAQDGRRNPFAALPPPSFLLPPYIHFAERSYGERSTFFRESRNSSSLQQIVVFRELKQQKTNYR